MGMDVTEEEPLFLRRRSSFTSFQSKEGSTRRGELEKKDLLPTGKGELSISNKRGEV